MVNDVQKICQQFLCGTPVSENLFKDIVSLILGFCKSLSIFNVHLFSLILLQKLFFDIIEVRSPHSAHAKPAKKGIVFI